VDDNTLMAIGCYTLEASFYKLLNSWCNVQNRSVDDLKYVTPYLKVLIESLRKLPAGYRYSGYGIRILDASVHPMLKTAFDNYKSHFAVGKVVNFYSICSFGYDENLLDSFINKGVSKPTIVLKCEKIVGYKIENLSMMYKMNNSNEGEVLVECPSFFKVIKEPLKIKNHIIVEIEYILEKSADFSYLIPHQKKKKE